MTQKKTQTETDAPAAPKPNLIFAGLKNGREPIESFSDGTRHAIAPADVQTIEKVVKTKDGERREVVAVPFFTETDPALVIRTLGSRLYKTPTEKEIAGDEKSGDSEAGKDQTSSPGAGE